MTDLNEPVAWAVIDDGGVWFTRVRRDDALEAYRRAVAFCEDTGRIVPLYRSPAPSDAERHALADAAEAYEYDRDDSECVKIAATLRGLLERLG